jgi:tRNA C32,U32 (ribose-2'-O)-methylase TrmJ
MSNLYTSAPADCAAGQRNTDDPASAEQMHLFYIHLQETLALIKFLDLKNPRRVLSRLKLLFNRARVQTKELNILRGILATIQLKLK